MHQLSLKLCRIYESLLERGEVSFPLQQSHIDAIDSVVKTVNAPYFEQDRFPSKEDKAVAYLCFIIKDHPVTDGNKRLAVLWFDAYCKIENLKVKHPAMGYDALALTIEKATEEMDSLHATVKELIFGV